MTTIWVLAELVSRDVAGGVDSAINPQSASGVGTLELRSERQGEEVTYVPYVYFDTETAVSS